MRALFIADTFDYLDLDYLQRQAGSGCHVELIGKARDVKQNRSAHGDHCAQCAIRAANTSQGLTHLFLTDRRWNRWQEVYIELVKDFPNLNGSYSFGRIPQNETSGWGKMFEDTARTEDRNAGKLEMFATGLHFFASGNWGDGDVDSDLAWPQALWADRYSNAFLIAACDDKGRPATFTSQAGERLDEGQISISYPGVMIPVRNPVNGKTEYVSGTSFATPLCAGDVTGRGMTDVDETKAYWESALSIHESWYEEWLAGEHHPAFGRGNIRNEEWYR